jgi:hypothetical protein
MERVVCIWQGALSVMPFFKARVNRLLTEHFHQIEAIWDQDPYDPIKVYAVTIKEFMTAHQIDTVDEGVRKFLAFKERQQRKLTEVGLGGSESDESVLFPVPADADASP